MKPLDRLRWKLTAWYVATFGAILVAFSVGLFFTISRSIATKLDRSLARAATELEESVMARGSDGAAPDDLKIPDRALYLFDAGGALLTSAAPSAPVRTAARDAVARGESSQQFDIGHEHTLLVHALRFVAPNGKTLVAVAAADTEELEDEYANLITVVSIALGLALIAVGIGGYVLARRSSQPIEDSFERMRRFTADAAHELRTPIAFLRAQSELALERDRPAHEYSDALREVVTGAARIGTMVDDLFTLARVDSGERRLERTPIFLDDIVLDEVSKARVLATSHDIDLDIAAFEETPVIGDSRLLGQLVRIVIDNAIKYTPNGRRVTLGVGVRESDAVVIVEDCGIGISPADLPRIFDRFYRASNARSTADGAGLGLSIAQWIAAAHGGRIDITSTPDAGTRVCITIPVGSGTGRGVVPAPGVSRPTSRVTVA